MLKQISIFTTSLVICLSAYGALAGDWPTYRGPNYDGISTETGWFDPAASVKVLWTRPVGTGFGTFAVVKGLVYTMGNDGSGKDVVYCFEAKTGEQKWTFSYPCALEPKLYEGGPGCTPTVVDGKVYTLSKQGHAFCFDAVKGTKIWGTKINAKPPSWGYAGSATVVGNVVVLNAGSEGTGLRISDGSPAWKSGTGKSGYSTPVPYKTNGKTNVILFLQKSVAAFGAADGRKVWSFPWQTKYDVNAGDPILLDENKKLFISTGYGKGCAMLDISGSAPKQIWKNRNMKNKHCSSVAYKGAIYGFDETSFACIDVATGNTKWSEGLGRGTVSMADGKLLALNEKGTLYIVEATPDSFKKLASYKILKRRCWVVPVLSNGLIYAKDSGRKGAGDMVCISLSGK